MIKRVIIKNYKCFKKANIELKAFKNVIVGNNGVGKSTLIEAISLALGFGRSKFEVTPYIFNIECLREYEQKKCLPEILIELYFNDPLGELSGNNNSLHETCSGLYMKISFDESYRDLYQKELESNDTMHLPCEYYKIETHWFSQSPEPVRQYKIPYTIQIVDTTSLYFNSSSNQYINQLIEKYLGDEDSIAIKSSLRHLKERFDKEQEIAKVNSKLNNKKEGLSLSVDTTSRIEKRDIIYPFLDEIPIIQMGAGEICHLKTLLSLGNGTTNSPKSKIIIIEEPESHLSHTKMYEMLYDIEKNLNKSNSQIIITTHSSFVANKLDLSNLLILNRHDYIVNGENLGNEDSLFKFFTKVSHYPTLRMILCEAVILVEGPADEMVVTYHYYKLYKKHPFNDGIELIVVGGVAFKAYVDLLSKLHKKVSIITDNDGLDKDALLAQRGLDSLPENIKLFTENDTKIKTLEPSFVESNKSSLQKLSNFIRTKNKPDDTEKELSKYMENNKTEWSYKLLEEIDEISFEVPSYIREAVEWVRNDKE